MARRILLVDDEVAVLLTMKAVLEISGFEVDTAASAREGKLMLHKNDYQMVITDMRMEDDEAGREVIDAARLAANHPTVALLTAFPVAEEDWQEMGADKLLVKPVHTRILIEQIEKLMSAHEAELARKNGGRDSAKKKTAAKAGKKIAAKSRVKKKAAKKSTKAAAKKQAASRTR